MPRKDNCMDRKEALHKLGIEGEGSLQEIEAGYRHKHSQLLERSEKAPIPALKEKYRQALSELEAAYHYLTNTDNEQTETSLQLLPGKESASPQPTPAAAIEHTSASTSPVVPATLAAGQSLLARYQIKECIGTGNTSAMYLAFDANRQEDVAVKFLLPGVIANEAMRQKLVSEVQVASQLVHTNIANVYDAHKEGDAIFITMDMLRGKTLRTAMTQREQARGRFSLKEVRDIFGQLGAALEYAHKHTVHCGVRPESIWLTNDGKVKLMDFGIARSLATARLTPAAACYMAPEQLKGGREPDQRADQYALAVIIYELFTGSVPTGRSEPIKKLRPEVPATMSAAVDKALAANPQSRYASIGAFVKALNQKPKTGNKWAALFLLILLAWAVSRYQGTTTPQPAMPNSAPQPAPAVELEKEANTLVKQAALELKSKVMALQKRWDEKERQLVEEVQECENRVSRYEGKAGVQNELAQARREHGLAKRLQALCDREFADGEAKREAVGKIGLAEELLREKEYASASQALQRAEELYARLANELALAREAKNVLLGADELGAPALHEQTRSGDTRLLAYMLKLGARAQAKDSGGQTPLHVAATIGNGEMVNYWLAKGAPLDAHDNEGDTVLHVAIKKGRAEMVKLLLEKGAGMEDKTGDGYNGLELAVIGNNKAVLAAIVASGGKDAADAAAEIKKDGQLPLHNAARDGDNKRLCLLLAQGGDINGKDKNGMTPLHYAARYGKLATTKLLVRAGAKVEEKNNRGKSALFYAWEFKQQNVADYLAQCSGSQEWQMLRRSEQARSAAENEKKACQDAVGKEWLQASDLWRQANTSEADAREAEKTAHYADAAAHWDKARNSFAQARYEGARQSALVAQARDNANAEKKACEEEVSWQWLQTNDHWLQAKNLETQAREQERQLQYPDAAASWDKARLAYSQARSEGNNRSTQLERVRNKAYAERQQCEWKWNKEWLLANANWRQGTVWESKAREQEKQGQYMDAAASWEEAWKLYARTMAEATAEAKQEEERKRMAEAEAKRELQRKRLELELPGFTLLRDATYTCGGQTHTVKEYRHHRTGMEFVRLPGGTFEMGSNHVEEDEQPVHRVTVNMFLLSKYEVTQAVWEKIMGDNPSNFKGANRPVEQVSWQACQEFCRKTGLFLPSEAQWEYACRAGTQSKYYWGKDMSDEHAWHEGNANIQTHDVGEKLPNAFGLYDMSGNVWEWCQDWYHDSYQGAPNDGSPWEKPVGTDRVYRGGSWRNGAQSCRSAYRYKYSPEYNLYTVGFRCVAVYPSLSESK